MTQGSIERSSPEDSEIPETNLAHEKQSSTGDEGLVQRYHSISQSATLTSALWTEAREIQQLLSESEMQRMKSLEIILSSKLPQLPPDLTGRLGQMRINYALVTTMLYLRKGQLDQATEKAKRAFKIAQGQNDERSSSRCRYWMGRIEFQRRNLMAAQSFFAAAQPCIMNEGSLEGKTVEFYLGLSNFAVSEEYRKRALLNYQFAQLERSSQAALQGHSIAVENRKRKREAQPYNLVFRPVRRSDRETVESTSIQRRRVRIVYNCKDPSSTSTKNPSHELDAFTDKSGRRLEQQTFTFRCYPVGLATRTRTTNLFPLQPGEKLLSAEQWQVLSGSIKDKVVTMRFLAQERRFLRKKADGAVKNMPR